MPMHIDRTRDRRSPGFVIGLACLLGVVVPASADEAETIRFSVRVIDTAGQPVPDAVVRGHVMVDEVATKIRPVLFDGQPAVGADAQGKVVTPPLPAGKAYVLQVDAPGRLTAFSRWSETKSRGTAVIRPVTLRRLLTARGTVVDRDGHPIAGATLIQSGDGPERTEATTDADGRFSIAGIPEGIAFLFAEKQGYRFHGQQVAAESGPVRIILEPREAANPRTMKTLPLQQIPLTEEECRALALNLLVPKFEEILAQKQPEWDRGLFDALARTDPGLFQARLDAVLAISAPRGHQTAVLNTLIETLYVRDGEPALALLAKLDGADNKAGCLIDNILGNETLRLRQPSRVVVDQAVATLKNVPDDHSRLWYTSSLAHNLEKFGEDKRARELREAQIAAHHKEDRPAYFRLDLCRELALVAPDEAEAVLNAIDVRAEKGFLGRWIRTVPHICGRLARVDPDRGERVADRFFELADVIAQEEAARAKAAGNGNAEAAPRLDPTSVALLRCALYSRLAEVAAATDKPRAARLFDKGLTAVVPLRSGRWTGDTSFYCAPGTVLSTAIPAAEAIDPALSAEVFWRSLALRVPVYVGEDNEANARDLALAGQAQMLHRYDPAIADAVLAPILIRHEGRNRPFSWIDHTHLEMHGDAAVALANDLVRKPPDEPDTPREARRRTMAAERIYGDEMRLRRTPAIFHGRAREMTRESSGIYVYGPGDDF